MNWFGIFVLVVFLVVVVSIAEILDGKWGDAKTVLKLLSFSALGVIIFIVMAWLTWLISS